MKSVVAEIQTEQQPPQVKVAALVQKGRYDPIAPICYVSGCIVALFIWWLASQSAASPLHRFNPQDTAVALTALFVNARFWQGLAESMQRLAIGLSLAFVVGVPIGFAIGYSTRAGQLTYVPFQFLRMISPLSWTPVAIILLGIGSGPVCFLIAISAIWPIIINSAAGIRAADPQWLEVARCLGAGHRQIIRHILIRATLPHILIGLQLALGVAWIVLVPAEMLGVASGLGYMILDFRDVNDYASITALIIVIGMLGLCLDLPLRFLSRKIKY